MVFLLELLALAFPVLLDLGQQRGLLAALGELVGNGGTLVVGLAVGSEVLRDLFLLLAADAF